MKRFDHRSPAGIFIHLVYAVLVVGQIVMVFTLTPLWNVEWLIWPGYVLWFGSAVLGVLPIIIFRRRGRVEQGESYVKTNRLVTNGLYSIVRHPQFLALIYLGAAGALLTPHWATIADALVIGAASYAAMLSSDRHLVDKFGDEYREYKRRVPRAAFLWGLLRRIFRHDGAGADGEASA